MNRLQFRRLLQPGKIGKLELANRMIMAPMATRFVAPDGSVTEKLIDYYVARAKGGVGLIVVEAAYPRHSGYPGRIYINDDRCVVGLKRLADAIHDNGGKVIIQLNPSRGRADEVEPVCASLSAPVSTKKSIPKELTKAEIAVLVREFSEGVRRARSAGFDGVMVHGAHGYIILDFLSPVTNRRTDEYGGSIENRTRFARELVTSAKREAGIDYPIIFRISANDHLDNGLRPEAAAVICRILEDAGVDAVDISAGAMLTAESASWVTPLAAVPLGCNREAAKVVKQAVSVPVSVAGRISDPYLAEEILEQEQADFVTLGRTLIADPDFPNKVKEGCPHEIRKCIACSNCVSNVELKMSITCTVNPAVGSERELILKPAIEQKKILVIGGGPGGLEAAKVAASRGHQAEVWEKSARLGGQLNLAVMPPHKQELKHILDYELSQLEKLKVPIILNKEATADSVIRWAPDTVIVATGARPLILNIPGMEAALAEGIAVIAWDVLSGRARVGNNVVIIGGNLVGCETAEFLVEKGKKVTVVEMRPRLAIDMTAEARRALLRRLREKKVTLMPEVECKAVSKEGFLEASDSTGKTIVIEAENFVLATGAVANNGLSRTLKQGGLRVCEVGDCISPRKLHDAIHEGARAGISV